MRGRGARRGGASAAAAAARGAGLGGCSGRPARRRRCRARRLEVHPVNSPRSAPAGASVHAGRGGPPARPQEAARRRLLLTQAGARQTAPYAADWGPRLVGDLRLTMASIRTTRCKPPRCHCPQRRRRGRALRAQTGWEYRCASSHLSAPRALTAAPLAIQNPSRALTDQGVGCGQPASSLSWSKRSERGQPHGRTVRYGEFVTPSCVLCRRLRCVARVKPTLEWAVSGCERVQHS